MHPGKGPRGRLVLLSLCSLSPGVLKGAPARGRLVHLYVVCFLVLWFLGHHGKAFMSLCSLSPGDSERVGEDLFVLVAICSLSSGAL